MNADYRAARGCSPRKPDAPRAEEVIRRMRGGGGECEECERLRARLAAAEERLGREGKILTEIAAIVRESRGVDGWHLNGDVALWDEFTAIIDLERWEMNREATEDEAALEAWREREGTSQ